MRHVVHSSELALFLQHTDMSQKEATFSILKTNPKKYASSLHVTIVEAQSYQNCVNHSIVISWNALRNCQNSRISSSDVFNTFYVQANFASHSAGIKKKNGKRGQKCTNSQTILTFLVQTERSVLHWQTERKKKTTAITVLLFKLVNCQFLPFYSGQYWTTSAGKSRNQAAPAAAVSWRKYSPNRGSCCSLWPGGLSHPKPAGIHLGPRKHGWQLYWHNSLWGCAVSGSLKYSALKELPKKPSDTSTAERCPWLQRMDWERPAEALYQHAVSLKGAMALGNWNVRTLFGLQDWFLHCLYVLYRFIWFSRRG